MTYARWAFLGIAALWAIAGGVLLGIQHNNEALGAWSMGLASALTAALLFLRQSDWISWAFAGLSAGATVAGIVRLVMGTGNDALAIGVAVGTSALGLLLLLLRPKNADHKGDGHPGAPPV